MPGFTTTQRPSRAILYGLLCAATWALGGCSGGAGTAPAAGGERQTSAPVAAGTAATPAGRTAGARKQRPEARDFKSRVFEKRGPRTP
jgi:hypothetical protein